MQYLVRPARDSDLDAIAAFEVDIALVSFGDEAITDRAFHRRRVAAALGKAGETMLVAVPADVQGEDAQAADAHSEDAQVEPVGWAWLSGRTNSLTGERYGNFRSLAVRASDDRPAIGELLMSAVLDAADRSGLTHLTGKVNAANTGMRALYRAFGFTATHLTMEKRTGPGGRQQPGPGGKQQAGPAGSKQPGPASRP